MMDKALNIKTISKSLTEKIIYQLGNEKLYRILQMDKEVKLRREDVMLDNILNYSQENTYDKGLFFIGSGHRASIMTKIKEHSGMQDVIQWKIYDPLTSSFTSL